MGSSVRGKPQTSVSKLWSGALSDSSFTVAVDLPSDTPTKLVVTTADDLTFRTPVHVGTLTAAVATDKLGGGSHYTAKRTVTGLSANTSYRYGIVPIGQRMPDPVGTIKTAPAAGVAAAFKFLFGSCNSFSGDEASPAFRGMLNESALFFVHLGDIAYDDYVGTDVKAKRAIYTRTHRAVTDVANFYKTCPVAYTWSDHDSAGNDHHRASVIGGTTYDAVIGRSRTVYEETVPHYTLQHSATILQSWRIAKTCFILLDTQTLRTTAGSPAVCLGTEQYDLVVSLATAAANDGCTMLFLISAATWTASPFLGWKATWATEQTNLLDDLKAITGIPRIVVLVGDAHDLGADDGANTDYSTGGGMQIVQFQSSPLHQINMSDAGPFSWLSSNSENSSNNRAYAVVDVSADNLNCTVTFKGRNGAGTVSTIATYNTDDLTGW